MHAGSLYSLPTHASPDRPQASLNHTQQQRSLLQDSFCNCPGAVYNPNRGRCVCADPLAGFLPAVGSTPERCACTLGNNPSYYEFRVGDRCRCDGTTGKIYDVASNTCGECGHRPQYGSCKCCWVHMIYVSSGACIHALTPDSVPARSWHACSQVTHTSELAPTLPSVMLCSVPIPASIEIGRAHV